MKYVTILLLLAGACVGGPEPDPFISQQSFVSFPIPTQMDGGVIADNDLRVKFWRDKNSEGEDGSGDSDEKESDLMWCDEDYPNLLWNGDFEFQPYHACGWSSFDASQWGLGVDTVCDLEDHDSCVLRIKSAYSASHYMMQLFQQLYLNEHRDHVLMFDAKADVENRRIEVGLFGDIGIGPLADGIEISLNTVWHTYQFPFRTTNWESDSILIFGLAGGTESFYLDNVRIIPTSP